MKKIVLKCVVLLLLLHAETIIGQTPRFYKEIQAFKLQDSLHFPPANAILFVGSSSFQKWKDVQDYFPKHIIINRGFGGSTLPDVIRYASDIILPYHPKQIVIYCGEYDIAEDTTITPTKVLRRLKTLLHIIRGKYKNIQVDYISIKPSPSKAQWQSKMLATNQLIQAYLANKPHTRFIDVYHAMLNADGTINETIFIQDHLHMNAKGYHIWQKILEPILL
jgi:lysophospholipase L1-like esterase